MSHRRTPNHNLWSIEYSLDGAAQRTKLWILGASAGTASSKARRLLRSRGEKLILITKVEHEGTIDVF